MKFYRKEVLDSPDVLIMCCTYLYKHIFAPLMIQRETFWCSKSLNKQLVECAAVMSLAIACRICICNYDLQCLTLPQGGIAMCHQNVGCPSVMIIRCISSMINTDLDHLGW